MKNIVGIVEYDGNCFFGWQIQKDVITVQETLESKISCILGNKNVKVYGASRTDRFVHSKGQTFNFKADLPYPISEFKSRLNLILPPSIAIKNLKYTTPDFHSRYNASSKKYEYTINRQKNPLERHICWYIRFPIDFDILSKLSQIVIGKHFFGAFQKADPRKIDCTISKCKWKKEKGDKLRFIIEGDFFLRGMVRALVGAMIYSAKGRMSIPTFENMLSTGIKSVNYPLAPGHGLCLKKVYYRMKGK